MKDRTTKVAYLILVVLISVLIYLSYQRNNEISNAIQSIQATKSVQVDGVNGNNGYTPIKGVDYQDGNSCNTQPTTGGATIDCDNTVSSIQNGINGQNGLNGTAGASAVGVQGESAYQEWLSVGNTGTQNEWRYSGDSLWQPLDKVTVCV